MDDYNQIKQTFKRLYTEFEASTGPEARLGEWWVPHVKHFLGILDSSTDPVDAIQRCQMTHHFTIYTKIYTKVGDRHRIERYVEWMINYLKSTGFELDVLPRNVAETPYCLPQNLVEAPDGRLVSPDMMRTLELWHSILSQLNDCHKIRTIFELGSGYGGTARTGKLLLPDATLFLCDLPTSLFFSHQYISTNFPDSKILLVENESDLDCDLRTFDFVFLSPHHASCLKQFEFDLFFNTNSLTEMKYETVGFWFDWIQSNNHCQYLFLDNRFLAYFHVENFRKDECACFFSLDRDWEFLIWSFDDPAHHSPYLASLHCRTLRVFAERRAVPLSNTEAKSLSDKLISDVQWEDWFRESYVHEDDGTEAINTATYLTRMPRTFGCHRFDGTREGTLFKLFEAFRFNQSPESLFMLTNYLRMISVAPHGIAIKKTHLLRDVAFEELGFLGSLNLTG